MNLMFCLRRARDFHGSNIASYRDGCAIKWTEMYDRVHRLAGFLRDLGIQKGDRVAVWMLNSQEYLELYYATMMAGIVIVPLNTRWHENDVAFTLNDSGAVGLVVDERFAPMVEKVPRPEHVIFAGCGVCPDGMTPWSAAGSACEFEEPDGDDLAGLFYTSGTTGGPKGVMLTHRNLWSNTINGMLIDMRGGTWLHAAPMFHIADAGAIYTVTATGGAHAYLASFDPLAFLQTVERYRVTDTVLVPTMVNLLVNHPDFGKYDLASLKNFIYGASPMPTSLVKAAMEKLPLSRFRQGYGLTEASPVLTMLDYEDHFGPAVTSAGKPVFGTEVRVVDEFDRDVADGECGEVIGRGANIMKGYWRRPEITADTLRGGWLHTGDLGRFDENGFLYILDRKKDMIKPGGENVYSPEVESMIASHPAVLEVAVIGVPDPKWGETIRAVIACRASLNLTESELIDWCRERMTHFKCPTSVVFVDTLPKGGTGKVQKAVLRKQYGGEKESKTGAS